MLAPIITKDMKLFPSRPLPAGIKNVRSRAQSLDQFNQVQSSGSARGRIVAPVKPRSSQSTGNLPAAAAAAAAAASSTSGTFTSRSPPKTTVHRKTTLTAIQEGVEMGHNHNPNALRDDRHTESQSDGILSSSNRKNSKKTMKNDKENETTTKNGHFKFLEGAAVGECRCERKTKKSVVKWIASAFRKSKDKDSSDHSSSNSS